jgi:homocysteine S-methyltransferase
VPPVPRTEKSYLGHALAKGRFVTIVELLPPKGHESEQMLERARLLKIHGIDLVHVPEGPTGARMSALSLAVLTQQRTGIETILQYTCRDRNLLGMQSDLLGAHAMGVRNLLVMTGEVHPVGDYPDATAVFDVDSIGLVNMVSRLNHGLDIGGQPIGSPTAFHVGVLVNPGAEDLDAEIRRFEYKVEAGAEFAVTRPVFDPASFEQFHKRIEPSKLPIILGLFPFESVLNAEFMANEVAGMHVPPAVLDRMRRAPTPEAAAVEGIAIAREVGRALKGAVQGLHVSASMGHVEPLLEIVESVRETGL